MNKKHNYISILMTIAMFSMLTFSQSAFGEELGKEHAADLKKGKRIYSISCVLCHGSKGKGDGPASVFIGPYSHPRPNDFTRGVFKYRSTESGDLPTFSDLMRTIGYGIPGYMPSFRHLGEEGVRQVALYISDTFIEDELSSEPMAALKDGEENSMAVKNVVVQSDSKPNNPETARIEVYKEITTALNNIAKNSLTAMEQEENPKPTLNMYKNIITTLNGIVSNLETKDSTPGIESTGLKHINLKSPIGYYATRNDATISLEKEEAWRRHFISVDAINPRKSWSDNTPEDNLTSGENGAPLPAFSDLFIGEENLTWD